MLRFECAPSSTPAKCIEFSSVDERCPWPGGTTDSGEEAISGTLHNHKDARIALFKCKNDHYTSAALGEVNEKTVANAIGWWS